MTNWEALQIILTSDAESFREQSSEASIRASLATVTLEQQKLQTLAAVLSLQAAAALHYLEIMEELDQQVVPDDGGTEPNEVEARP
jgi:hypothetical protein